MKYLVLILALGLSGCDSLMERVAESRVCRSIHLEHEPGDLVKFKPTGETVRILHQLNFCHSKNPRKEYVILFPGDLSMNTPPEKIEPL